MEAVVDAIDPAQIIKGAAGEDLRAKEVVLVSGNLDLVVATKVVGLVGDLKGDAPEIEAGRGEIVISTFNLA